MARLREYSASYMVQGVRFLFAPRKKVVSISLAEAELKMYLELQVAYPGKEITLGKITAGKQAK